MQNTLKIQRAIVDRIGAMLRLSFVGLLTVVLLVLHVVQGEAQGSIDRLQSDGLGWIYDESTFCPGGDFFYAARVVVMDGSKEYTSLQVKLQHSSGVQTAITAEIVEEMEHKPGEGTDTLLCKLKFVVPDTLGIGQYLITLQKAVDVDSTFIQVGSAQILTILACDNLTAFGNLDSTQFYCPGSLIYEYAELRVSSAESEFFDKIIAYLNSDVTKVVAELKLAAPVTKFKGNILLQIPYQTEVSNAPLTYRLSYQSTGLMKDTLAQEKLKVAAITSSTLSSININACVGQPADMVVNTSGSGLSATWQKVLTPQFEATASVALAGKNVNDIFISGSKVFVASSSGLSVLSITGTLITSKTKANGLPSNNITSVFATGDTIAIGTDEGLAISTDGGTSFRKYSIDSNLVSNEIRSVIITDKLIIVGTVDGISYSDRDQLSWQSMTTLTYPNRIPSNLINHVFQDKAGVIYVSSTNGISLFRNWPAVDTTLTTINGLPRNQVNAVFVDDAGTIYAAVRGAVAVAPWKSYTFSRLSNGIGSANVQEVLVAGSKIYAAMQTYASSEGGLVLGNLKASEFTKFILGIGTEINCIALDPITGTVFAGTSNGVFKSSFSTSDLSGETGNTLHFDAITANDANYRYQLSIQNDKGCTALSDLFALPNIPEDLIATGSDLKTCGGYSGQVIVSNLKPQEPYIFNYTSSNSYSGSLPDSGQVVRADSLGRIILQILPIGTYSDIQVRYDKDKRCPSNAAMVEIKDPELPSTPEIDTATSILEVCYGDPIVVEINDADTLQSNTTNKESFRWFLTGNKIANPGNTTTYSYSFRYPPTSGGSLFVFKRDSKTLCSSDTVEIPYIVEAPLTLSYVISPPDSDTSANGTIVTKGLKPGTPYAYAYQYTLDNTDTLYFQGNTTASILGTDTLRNLKPGFYSALKYTNLTECSYSVFDLVSVFPPREAEPDGPISVVVAGSKAGFLRYVSSDSSCVLSESFLDSPYGVPVGRIYQTQANQQEKLRVEMRGWVQFDLKDKIPPAAKIRRVEYRAITLDDLGQKVCEVPVTSAAGDLNFSISQVSYNKYGPYTAFDSVTFADLFEPKYVDFTTSASAQSAWVSLGPDAIVDIQNRLNNSKPFQIGLSLAGSDFNLPVYQFHGLIFGEAEADHEIRVFYDVFDYGDAPEPTYATYESGSVAGPFHKINPIAFNGVTVSPLYIGTPPDEERDGQPNAKSQGDDLTNIQDEDISEASLTSYLIAGTTVKLRVPVTNYTPAKATTKLYIDWNKNGDFSLVDEVYLAVVEAASANTPYEDTLEYEILVPYGNEPDTIQCRIRISTAASIDAYGEAPNGEVEDFFLVQKGVDYGDLPVSAIHPRFHYSTRWEAGTKTSLGVPGARHVVEPRLYLGKGVDSEEFPTPDVDAGSINGGDDDAPGQLSYGVLGDDENGVLLLSPLLPGEMAFIKVNFTSQELQNQEYKNKDAFLDAFVDWNGNGQFDLPGEKLLFTHQIGGGASNDTNFIHALANPSRTAVLASTAENGADSVILGFQVPADAVFDSNVAYMRFRLSWEHYGATYPSRFPMGLGPDNLEFYERYLYYVDPELPYPQGEVEDYAVPLLTLSGKSWYDHDVFGDIDLEEEELDSLHLVLVWGGIRADSGLPDTVGYREAYGSKGLVQDVLYNLSVAPEEVGVYMPQGGIRYSHIDSSASGGSGFLFKGLIPGDYLLIPKKYLETDGQALTDAYPKHRVLTIRDNGVSDSQDNDALVTDGTFTPGETAGGGVLVRITDKNPKFPEVSSLSTVGSTASSVVGSIAIPDPFSNIGIGWMDEPNIEANLDIVGVDFPTSLTCGNFNIVMHFSFKNPTETPLDSLVATLNLKQAYGDAFVGNTEVSIVDSAYTTTSGNQKIQTSFYGAAQRLSPLLNSVYNGNDQPVLLSGADRLTSFFLPGDSVVCIRIEFEINPKALQKFSSNYPPGWYSSGTVTARAVGFNALGTEKQPILDFRLVTQGNLMNPRFGRPFQVMDSTDEFDDPILSDSLLYPFAGDAIRFEGSVIDRGLDGKYLSFPSPPSLTGRDKYLDENDPLIHRDFCWQNAKVSPLGKDYNIKLNSDCLAYVEPASFLSNGAEDCSFSNYPEGSYYRLIFQEEETGETVWASTDRKPFDGSAYLGKSLVYKLRSVSNHCSVTTGIVHLPQIDTLVLVCPPTIDTLPVTMLPLTYTDIDSVLNNARTWLDSSYVYYAGIAVPETPCIPVSLKSVKDELTTFPVCTIEPNTRRMAFITRTFFFSDVYGNETSCSQQINFYQPDIFLPNCTVELERRGAILDTLITPESLLNKYQMENAVPYYYNGGGARIYLTENRLKHLTVIFNDEVVQTTTACGRTIARTWTFLNDCTANPGARPNLILPQDSICRTGIGWQGQKYSWKQEIFVRDTVKPVAFVPDLDNDGFEGNGFTSVSAARPTDATTTYDPQDVYYFPVQSNTCLADFKFSRSMLRVVEQTNWCFDVSVFTHRPVLDLDERPIPGKFEFTQDPTVRVTGNCSTDYTVSGLKIPRDSSTNYFLRIRVFDSCDNETTIYIPIRAIDKIAPIVKCKDKVQVVLDNFGNATISAASLNAGTSDFCGKIAWLRLRMPVKTCTYKWLNLKNFIDANKNGTIDANIDYIDENGNNKPDALEFFGLDKNTLELISPLLETLPLSCCDSASMPVELWASDLSGNLNYCWTTISIEDKSAFSYILPPSRQLFCTDEIASVDLLRSGGRFKQGTPQYAAAVALLKADVSILRGEGCTTIQKEIFVSSALSCDTGTIDITWQLTNPFGGQNAVVVTPKATLTILPKRTYNLLFPGDLKGECSTVMDTAIVVDEAAQSCSNLISNIQDKVYASENTPFCYKVYRTYTVLDACAYDAACGEPAQWAVIVPRDPDANGADGVHVLVRDQFAGGQNTAVPGTGLYVTPGSDGWEELYFEDACGAGKNRQGEVCERVLVSGNHLDNTRKLQFNSALGLCPNSSQDFIAWIFTQQIQVVDSTQPVVRFASDSIFATTTSDCTSEVMIDFKGDDGCTSMSIDSSGRGILQIQNIYLQTGDEAPVLFNQLPSALRASLYRADSILNLPQAWRFTAQLKEGRYVLWVSLRDQCGNTSISNKFEFYVRDTSGTPPICFHGFSTVLTRDPITSNAEVVLYATDFIERTVSDCNGQGTVLDSNGLRVLEKYYVIKDINFDGVINTQDSLTKEGIPIRPDNQLRLTCEDLQGDSLRFIKIRIYTVDQRNNWAWCESYILLSDPDTLCVRGSLYARVSGSITTDYGVSVEGVEVTASGSKNHSVFTGRDGTYLFSRLTPEQDITVTALYDNNYMEGISTFDLVLLNKHIVGAQPLSTPVQYIAADVNNSKSISILDMIQLRKLILGNINTFEYNTSWRFIDADYVFQDSADWLKVNFPEVLNFNNITGSHEGNFRAIKVGDLNGSALKNVKIRSSEAFVLLVEEGRLQEGEEQVIDIRAENLHELSGYQFALNIDPTVADVEVVSGMLTEEYFAFFKDFGQITVSWNGKMPFEGLGTLFSLKVKARKSIEIRDLIKLNQNLLTSEAYLLDGKHIEVGLQFDQTATPTSGYALFQNIPNPFGATGTKIGFVLPEAGETRLYIYDVSGRLVKSFKGYFEKGYHEINWNGIPEDGLEHTSVDSGVYFYTLQAGKYTSAKKMILLK